MTGIVILWIVLSILFASLGRNRKIGFGRAFLTCILLTPLIGLIVVLVSEKHSESLMKLKIALDSGNLTKEEYDKKIRKIVPNNEDRQNMFIGYAVVSAIGLIIYLIFRYLV
jgi:hypothetical protein